MPRTHRPAMNLVTCRTAGSARPIGRETHLTSGKVGHLVGTSCRTVCKWIDSGVLKGHRLPESLDRRVRAGDLVDFLLARNAPVPAELVHLTPDGKPPPPPARLACGLSASERKFLPAGVESVSLFELGRAVARRSPAAVLLGTEILWTDALSAAASLASLDQRPAVAVMLPPDRTHGPLPGVDFLVDAAMVRGWFPPAEAQ